MKKFSAWILAVGCALFLSGCADSTVAQVESGAPKEIETVEPETAKDAVAETDKAEESGVPEAETQTEKENGTEEQPQTEKESGTEEESVQYEYPPEDNSSVVWESRLGYSMTYDPMVFTLDDTGELDIFTYHTAENLAASVYMSVQKYSDMDAQTLAEGLALQSGIDGVEVQDVWFGADGLETKNVYIEREAGGVTQIQIFYAIPTGEGALLLEIGSYVGVSATIDGYFEEMLGTFSLKE